MTPAERTARTALGAALASVATWRPPADPRPAHAALDEAREAIGAWRRASLDDTDALGACLALGAQADELEARLLGLGPVAVTLAGGAVALSGGAAGVRERVLEGLRGKGKIVGRRAA